MSVQKLRLKLGWSQQQLADASGLSVRTIQRIEAGYPASTETLKSLAAVFEVDFLSLDPEQNMSTTTTTATLGTSATPASSVTPEQQEAEAFKYVRNLRGFYLHLSRYLMVCSCLVAINLIAFPQRLWALWVIGGWGFGVLAHAARTFRPDWLLGPQWERREVEKRLGRPL